MRDPQRINPMIEQLRAFWLAHPDWRLGQVVCNASYEATSHGVDPFYVEDDEMQEGLSALAKKDKPAPA